METPDNKGFIYEFDKFVLDPRERLLLADGKPVHLTDKVFDTLVVLIENNDRLVTKDEMMAAIWDESFVEESNLAKNISRLRRILNTDGTQLIETLPKRGYRFRADVKQIDGSTSLVVRRDTKVKITHTVEGEPAADTEHRLVPPVRQLPARNSDLRILFSVIGLLLIIGSGTFLYFFLYRPKPITVVGGLKNLTSNVAEDSTPAWSPDGSKIAFTSNRDGAGDIYLMDADGSDVVRLTYTPARETSPVWSPDGKKIIFDSERDGNRELYIMNIDGSDQTRLTFNPTADAGAVSFSPDGKRIAFARNASNEGQAAFNYDIYTMNVDGSDVRQLTTDSEFDAEPIWSPDGTKILFTSGRERMYFKIYSVNPDGSGETKLMTNSSSGESAFSFTSDGKQIFCIGDTPEKVGSNQIYLMNADGTDRRQITSFTNKMYRFTFSPAAKQFAISGNGDGNFEIYTMDASNLLKN